MSTICYFVFRTRSCAHIASETYTPSMTSKIPTPPAKATKPIGRNRVVRNTSVKLAVETMKVTKPPYLRQRRDRPAGIKHDTRQHRVISWRHFRRSKSESRPAQPGVAEGVRAEHHAHLACHGMAVQVRRIKMPLPYGLNYLIREWRHPLHHPDDGDRAFVIYLSDGQDGVADQNIERRGRRHGRREAQRLVALRRS